MKRKPRKPPRRNPAARLLADSRYRRRVVKAKKGKTAYRRRPKHP